MRADKVERLIVWLSEVAADVAEIGEATWSFPLVELAAEMESALDQLWAETVGGDSV